MTNSKRDGGRKIGRDAKSGKFMSVKKAQKHPNSTVVETIKGPTKARGLKAGRAATTGKFVGGYKVLGETSDGIQILKPKGRPKSFTEQRLKKAISAHRAG